MSQWLFAGMKKAALPWNCWRRGTYEKAFEAMPVKSDRNDARGIAQLMRLGWFRPVHCKSMSAQETRSLLTARKLVQSKLSRRLGKLRPMDGASPPVAGWAKRSVPTISQRAR